MMKRQEIRQKDGIRGNTTDDCCISCWCGCCVIIQHEKEVTKRWELITMAYTAEGDMEAEPQH